MASQLSQLLKDILNKLAAVGSSRRTQFTGLSGAALSAFFLLLWSEWFTPAYDNMVALPVDERGAMPWLWMGGVAVVGVVAMITFAFSVLKYGDSMLERPPTTDDYRSSDIGNQDTVEIAG